MTDTQAKSAQGRQAKTPRTVTIKADELPLVCPRPQDSLWNSHPRVYLTMEQNKAVCPYCGTVYRLED